MKFVASASFLRRSISLGCFYIAPLITAAPHMQQSSHLNCNTSLLNEVQQLPTVARGVVGTLQSFRPVLSVQYSFKSEASTCRRGALEVARQGSKSET